jgi:NAD(P)-dependent dehydrogenase (short-subunit alcohol dehydrogenase family)
MGRSRSAFPFANPNAAAVITGAAGGIGAATAIELARRGANLALVDRAHSTDTAARARALGARVSVHQVDVTDPDAIATLVEEVEAEHGGAHIVVNCAGVSLLGYFEQMTLDEFKWLLDVNLWGTIAVTKAFLPSLMAQPAAHISNLSSGYGLIAPAGRTPYATSKYAVRGFTEAIAHELEDTGISVSVVHPGGIKTEIAMKARAASGIPAEVAQRVASSQTAMYKTTPETAGIAIVDGIERRRSRVMIGNDVRLLDAIARITPTHYWSLLRGSLKAATDTRAASPAAGSDAKALR